MSDDELAAIIAGKALRRLPSSRRSTPRRRIDLFVWSTVRRYVEIRLFVLRAVSVLGHHLQR